MKISTKFIFLPVQKPFTTSTFSYRALFTIFALFFVFTFTYTLLTPKNRNINNPPADQNSQLPQHIFDALIHYATETNTNASYNMSPSEVKSIADVLRTCRSQCNLLVFGLSHETFLWSILNHYGRTIFLDERSYLVSRLEKNHPHLETYDVAFTTKASELYELMQYYKGEVEGECKPVQNLLYSDCKLAINDLPNHIYDVAWDVIVIDGPSGFNEDSPGRMAAIYTAAVLARSKKDGSEETHVFLHEFDREVEQVCSKEFLCKGNLVETVDLLGHFVVRRMDGVTHTICPNSDSIITTTTATDVVPELN